jgi:hypothetical protein
VTPDVPLQQIRVVFVLALIHDARGQGRSAKTLS